MNAGLVAQFDAAETYDADACPFAPVPLVSGRNKPEPVKVVATPYLGRDPTTIRPRDWVYRRSIQRRPVRAILAPGAAGKTILSVGEALAMAIGRNLLGQEVPSGPKPVWLSNHEDHAEELACIIQTTCKQWSMGPEHSLVRQMEDNPDLREDFQHAIVLVPAWGAWRDAFLQIDWAA